jgi:hypothetical protein
MPRQRASIFALIYAHLSGDPLVTKARQDQKQTNRPGCKRGLMNCRDQECECLSLCPNVEFLRNRARRLRAGLNPEE